MSEEEDEKNIEKGVQKFRFIYRPSPALQLLNCDTSKENIRIVLADKTTPPLVESRISSEEFEKILTDFEETLTASYYSVIEPVPIHCIQISFMICCILIPFTLGISLIFLLIILYVIKLSTNDSINIAVEELEVKAKEKINEHNEYLKTINMKLNGKWIRNNETISMKITIDQTPRRERRRRGERQRRESTINVYHLHLKVF